MVDAEGHGVLVHLGIDTVKLKGEGFDLLAAEGDEVTAGQPVVGWNPAAIEAGGRSPICAVVALDANADALADVRGVGRGDERGRTLHMELSTELVAWR